MTEPAPPRSPDVLRDRLQAALARAEQLVRPVAPSTLERRAVSGGRTIRDLAFEIFRRGLAFVDAMDRGRLREDWLAERAPGDLEDGPALARYGALVGGRLAGWFEGAGAGEYTRAIHTAAGPRTGQELLELTAVAATERIALLEALLSGGGASAPARDAHRTEPR
jgi:hypothetical protein